MVPFKVSPPVGRGLKAITVGGPGRRASLLLGRIAEYGPQREVKLDLDREHVVAVVGKRGSGKTHTLGVLVEGLAVNCAPEAGAGGGLRRHAVIIFDTLNLFQWIDLPLADAKGAEAAHQRELLRKWRLEAATIEPTYWHPTGSAPANTKSREFSINPNDLDSQDWGRLLGLDIAAEPMGQLLNDLYLRNSQKSPKKGAVRHSAEEMLTILRDNTEIQQDYSAETIRGVRQRLSAMARSPIFEAGKADWTEALRPGAVSIFLLGRVQEDIRSVLVFLIIRRLLESRAEASEQSKHAALTGEANANIAVPPAWLVIDEAQNIMPSRNAGTANDILTRFVREGRNFGLSLAVTTQQPGSIDARVMAQVDTLIAHTLTVRTDVNYVLANLKSSDPDSILNGSKEITLGESIRLLDQGQCLVSSTDSERLIYCEVRPRLTLHGGFEG